VDFPLGIHKKNHLQQTQVISSAVYAQGKAQHGRQDVFELLIHHI
jgi:hypothetical protein